METKICNKCGIEKPYSEYHKMVSCVGGVRTTCKDCRKIEKQEYGDLPHVKKRRAEQYQLNKSSMRTRLRQYYWTLVSQYHQYKKSALLRQVPFELTKEDCEQFYAKDCYYCGQHYVALGIDRVNNDLGYILSNCVPCCKTCNWMKRTQTKEEFLNQIKLIYEKHESATIM